MDELDEAQEVTLELETPPEIRAESGEVADNERPKRTGALGNQEKAVD